MKSRSKKKATGSDRTPPSAMRKAPSDSGRGQRTEEQLTAGSWRLAGKASLLSLPSLLSQESADVRGVVLFSSEPGEFIEIDAHVAEDLTQEASPDVLTLVDGDDRCPTIFVLPERMASRAV